MSLSKDKIWPVLVSLGSASIMILAFFIPSVQDQWDRYQSRKVIERFETLGDAFFEEERYAMAEEAFAKAYELSEEKRLDLEIKRLQSKISQIGQADYWGQTLPEDIQEIDFQYLLHLQDTAAGRKYRVATLNSYGSFLAGSKRHKEALAAFQEALALDSLDVIAYINLGNLFDELGNPTEAERAYCAATRIEPANDHAHYNLALLYESQKQYAKALLAIEHALQINPTDIDAQQALARIRVSAAKKQE